MAQRWAPRNGGHRRTLAEVDRDAEALVLHLQGKSYREIQRHFGMKSSQNAFAAVKRAIADRSRDKFNAEEEFQAAIARIQRGIAECQGIIDTSHYLAGRDGKVVTMEDPVTGEVYPVLDSAPKQRAITEMRHLNDQLILLHDLRPASKQRITVVTQDVVDQEIAQLSEELARGGETARPGILREP